jgi:outer membrane protein
MTMNTRFPSMRSAVAAALVIAAPSVFALDLVGSYEQALKTDPTLLAAEEALLAGREKTVQGRALLKPQVAFTAGLSRINEQTSTSLPPQLSALIKPEASGTVQQAAVQLVQPLYDANAVATRQQLLQQTGLAEISHRQAQQDLIQRVGEAYFHVLLAQESLRVTQAEKAAVQLQRTRAQARFDLGRGKITDLQEVSAQASLALRQAQYHELTGADADNLAALQSRFQPTPPVPDDLGEWQAKGLAQNTRVLGKRGELAIAGAELDKYSLRSRPTLDLVASYQYKGQNGSLPPTVSPDNSRAAVIGLQLNVPLYTGGAISSKQRESLAKRRQAEQELTAAQRDARLQVQDAYLAVKTGVARIAALEQAVLSARTALEATTLGRDVGNRTELDVLDAQQRLFGAQLDLAQARHDYLLGRIRLASAAGELQPGDLRVLNAYLAS